MHNPPAYAKNMTVGYFEFPHFAGTKSHAALSLIGSRSLLLDRDDCLDLGYPRFYILLSVTMEKIK
jgi:hypothetical protein